MLSPNSSSSGEACVLLAGCIAVGGVLLAAAALFGASPLAGDVLAWLGDDAQ